MLKFDGKIKLVEEADDRSGCRNNWKLIKEISGPKKS